MKSSTVWRGHSTRPSLPAGTARNGQRSLVGATPLHLANARPFGRLKAPLGLSLLRCAAQTRACLWQAEQAHHANNEKQEVPAGELPGVHIVLVCGLWQGASFGAHPFFFVIRPMCASAYFHGRNRVNLTQFLFAAIRTPPCLFQKQSFF